MGKYILILVMLLSALCIYFGYRINVLNDKYKIATSNVKAYESLHSTSEDSKRVLKLTIEQLNYSRDSILDKMRKVQRELGVKNSRLEQLQYNLDFAKRNDTIILLDTIFASPQFNLDTIVGDSWFKTSLHLKYPNIISVKPEIELERYTFIEGRKETINPPKRFFLFRWFQKKQTVVEVKVKEMNPYVKNKDQRFIQIIR